MTRIIPVQLHAVLYLVMGLALAGTRPASAQIDDLRVSYDFLVGGRTAGGVLFKFPAAAGDYDLPGSFYDTSAYWGAYVCGESRATCAITDTYNAQNYALLPALSAAGKLQVERVNAHNSANIYDIATWQIAVMLGSVKNAFPLPSSTINAYTLVNGLSEVLRQSGLTSVASAAPGAKRAVSAGATFVYNGQSIANAKQAYSFRALAPEWLARDPLMDSPFAALVAATDLPPSNPAYAAGKITWTDWKPVTGENAWAFLIGPLQAAYIHHVIDGKKSFVPFNDIAVQNALDVLPTFAAMQSAIGGVHYAPAGTVGNEGDALVNPHDVSVENNLSLYAGLRILQSTLRATLENDAALGNDEKSKIEDALHTIDIMTHGGQADQHRQTQGLLSFFRKAAWQNDGFVQGGLANDPDQSRDWIPTPGLKAVDVETWGIAALGTKQIDQWFGYGAAFELWQRLKTWGAYGVGKTLWGVGYSNKDGNGIGQAGAYRQGVMSAEWTAGAINAVRNMMSTYGAETPSSPHFSTAQKYVAVLKQDEADMVKAIGALRVDLYAAAAFPGTPTDYAKLVAVKTKPYIYASRRYHIPFGWYANPLPSTASTAWVIMIADHYDPFGFRGAPN